MRDRERITENARAAEPRGARRDDPAMARPERFAFRMAAACWVVLALALAAPRVAGAGLDASVTGTVTLVWGDSRTQGANGPVPFLTDDAGGRVRLVIPDVVAAPHGGLLALNGRRVTARGAWTSIPGSAAAAVTVNEILPLEAPAAPAALTGSQPWVSILCKFQDVTTEPEALPYFQGMYASTYPGLDHYWREQSYDQMNVGGSGAYGWYVLPHTIAYYQALGYPSPGLDQLFNDCTAAADPYVNFAPYVGINMMFNGEYDPGYAWGGSMYATLDGVSKLWRTTWEPPWGFANASVIAHEMGHGFGLPHSSFNRSVVYDNCWDVMSDTYDCVIYDSTYGDLGQHTISFHKDYYEGWFRPLEKVTVASATSTSVQLERTALPSLAQPKMVQVPIGGSASKFYTVEARRTVGYDGALPGQAVIIHNVDTGQQIPAVIQGTNGQAGAIWPVGSVFRDATNNIGVAVTADTGTGFIVGMTNGGTMAAYFPAIDAHPGAGTSSNLNGVLEPGETVQFEPAWANASLSLQSPSGSATSFTGPPGATYTAVDAAAVYGSVPSGATASCYSEANCYVLYVSNPASRPALHWDATLTETLSTGDSKPWVLHVGRSFADVPPGFWSYKWVETMLHNGITAGCAGGNYCPSDSVTRWQMAVFLAKALAGASVPTSGTVPGLGSYNCTAGGSSVFADVAPTDTGCKFIHYIAAHGITAGCGGSLYCPAGTVDRWEMAVFLAKSMAGSYVPVSGTVPGKGSYNCVAGGSSVFTDVAPTDGGCKHIHYIAAKSVTAGCGTTTYCPAQVLPRDQMSVLVGKAFGLKLYAP